MCICRSEIFCNSMTHTFRYCNTFAPNLTLTNSVAPPPLQVLPLRQHYQKVAQTQGLHCHNFEFGHSLLRGRWASRSIWQVVENGKKLFCILMAHTPPTLDIFVQARHVSWWRRPLPGHVQIYAKKNMHIKSKNVFLNLIDEASNQVHPYLPYRPDMPLSGHIFPQIPPPNDHKNAWNFSPFRAARGRRPEIGFEQRKDSQRVAEPV